ncbi:MAG: hypothetical protein AABZ80_07140 [Gemmatimonadota bacterium]
MKRRPLTLALWAILLSSTARAQVGYDPSKSPYRDLEKSHELTITTGQFRASIDPAGVAPRTGPLLGAKYQWLVGGPASLTAEITRVGSERRVLDPLLPATCATVPAADCRLINTYRWPLYFADLGMALNLTGARSFHNLVPEVRGGLGFLTDFHTKSDVGDFAVGTRFVISFGAGIRWVPGGRYQLRLDFGDRLYSVKYPESYFIAAPDGSMIREPRCPADATSNTDTRCRPAKRSAWLHNGMLTIGLSYLFGGS